MGRARSGGEEAAREGRGEREGQSTNELTCFKEQEIPFEKFVENNVNFGY